VNQTALACKVVPTTSCDSKSECENKGGYCDDAKFYNRFGAQDDDFGSCILPLDYEGWAGALPQCRNKAMVPQGCAPLGYLDKETCLNTSSTFWHPLSSTKEECLSATGCVTFDQINVLAQLPKSECSACGKDTKVIFHWTEAKWTTATPTNLQWQKREVVSLYQWAPTIDFISMQSVLLESIQATVISDLRSQALCDFSGRSIIFEVVSCACGGGKDCFGDSSKLVESGSGRPCVGLGSTIQNPLATVLISEDAVSRDASERCTLVTLYTESIFNLEQGKQASFSPLTKVRQYDSFNIVLNKDEAIVGRVMSDGLEIDIEGELKSFKLCLQVSNDAGKIPSNFDQWDVGTPGNDKEFLRPLGLSPYNITLEASGAKRYCFEIENPKDSQTFYLIARLEDYEDKDGSLYGSEAAAWWTFAALYTVLAIFTLITFVLHFFGFPLHFYFLGLFIFFFIMCVIRAIYFYLLAAQVFDDGSALAVAYFLIEFPTLLYFTAFSCLGAFWIFLLYAHYQSRTQRFILGAALLFNLLLYILFVVLLILFETLSSKTSSDCPGRIPEEDDNTTQQIISIFYQSFMAGVSLLLAVIVSIYGGRLLVGLKKRNFEGKVAIVTAFCALGLLLHCAFILYLSIKYTYDFTIIVLMIVLSELIPIFAITLQFSFIRRTSKLPGYNRKANFLKALLKNFSSGSGNTSLSRWSSKSTQQSSASAGTASHHSSTHSKSKETDGSSNTSK
jgi:hypothetical protein